MGLPGVHPGKENNIEKSIFCSVGCRLEDVSVAPCVAQQRRKNKIEIRDILFFCFLFYSMNEGKDARRSSHKALVIILCKRDH